MQKNTKKLSSKKPLQKQVLMRRARPTLSFVEGESTRAKATQAKAIVRPEDYQVVLEWTDEDSCFIATIPAWNNVRTHGKTAPEASRNAQEVLQMLIASAKKTGGAVPEPQRAYSGKLQLRLPTSLHRKLAREAEREGVSLNHWLTTKLAS
jgi:predicted HicB family RNase H-like nuclease